MPKGTVRVGEVPEGVHGVLCGPAGCYVFSSFAMGGAMGHPRVLWGATGDALGYHEGSVGCQRVPMEYCVLPPGSLGYRKVLRDVMGHPGVPWEMPEGTTRVLWGAGRCPWDTMGYRGDAVGVPRSTLGCHGRRLRVPWGCREVPGGAHGGPWGPTGSHGTRGGSLGCPVGG